MSAVFGSEVLESVLLLPAVVGWAYMALLALLGLRVFCWLWAVGCGVERAGVLVAAVVSVGAREGWREGAPE